MGDIWHIRTTLTGIRGLPGVSSMFWQVTNDEVGPDVERSPEDAKNRVADFWNEALAAHGLTGLANDLTATTSGNLIRMDSATGEVIGVDDGGDDVVHGGNATAPLLPMSNQLLVQWRTGHFVGSRELHGRNFIPGATQDSMTDGRVSASQIGHLQTAIDAIVDTGLIVWSRPKPGRAGSFARTTSGSCWTEFAVLRSRRD